MEMPKDYNEAQAFTGEYEQIKLGGQICKIKDVKIEKTKTNKDMLVVAYDIAEGENKDYFKRRFEEDNRADKKWNGVHRIMVLNNEGKTNPFFKGFITSVESSNTGFKFSGEESMLKDKLFGAIFGREEYENAAGERKKATKIFGIRSVQKIREGVEIPEDRLLPPKADDWEFVADTNDIPF